MEGAVDRSVNAILQILCHKACNLDGPAHLPGDVAEELVHPIIVPRHGHHPILTDVLHDSEEDLYGLLGAMAVVGHVVELVRVVNT